jgi:hypothetical protein
VLSTIFVVGSLSPITNVVKVVAKITSIIIS